MIPVFLVQTSTSDNLLLSGFLTDGDKNKPVNILIHGFTSDFYSHKFFHEIANNLLENNQASISIQTRGTGMKTEFILSDRSDGVNIGSFFEKIEEAHLDITAWIKYLTGIGYSKFNLIGHSLGTIKATRYLFEGEHKSLINKLILLAPFDKNGYIIRHSSSQFNFRLADVEKQIQNGRGSEIVPPEYEDYPVSYNTYKSWYVQDDLSCMWDFYKGESYDFPILNQIDIPVQIIVGTKDEYLFMPEFNNLDEVKKILTANIKNLKLNLLENCMHTYVGFEKEVAKLVLEYTNE